MSALGAWIETNESNVSFDGVMSPLAWGRGSKPRAYIHACATWKTIGRPSRGGVDRNIDRGVHAESRTVAPRVGAWIETHQLAIQCRGKKSPLAWGRGSSRAPRVGAWIETCGVRMRAMPMARRPSRGGVDRNRLQDRTISSRSGSPLAWGRGSKRYRPRGNPDDRVAPRVGAWIETSCWPGHDAFGDRPSRGGVDRNEEIVDDAAPLAWGRGSKRHGADREGEQAVAPRVGAWIETMLIGRRRHQGWSPLAWGRGSKRYHADSLEPLLDRLLGAWMKPCWLIERRPSRGGVDRNVFVREPGLGLPLVAPRVGAWIETYTFIPALLVTVLKVAPRVGAWIETFSWTKIW